MSREHLFQQQQNAWIFSNLEQAVNVTLGPLERALGDAGMNVASIIEEMRKVNSGQGGPLSALSKAMNGDPETTLSAGTLELFERLDRVGLAKLAVEKLPLAFPVRGGFRHTSGFGYRYDPKTGSRRWHKGHDLAGARGTAIVATGDGVVTFAGRQGGYGKLVKIRHIRGFQTYYAHLNRIRVKLGQRVSRGEKIGDMGNTGRSTGVHLHYEVRINGNAVNPSKYMKAAPNVF
jgi:murein DD-endopeptidase MepM/ murein hydrolase activator NlpD